MSEHAAMAARVALVTGAVASAVRAAGRTAGSVDVVAVSKYASAADVVAAADCGLRDFGESYLKDGLEKIGEIGRTDLRWHFVGQLQSNKAAAAARAFDLVHSLASRSALRAISRAMTAERSSCRVLVQVRLDADSRRGGVEPEAVESFAREVAAAPGVELDGVMGVAPLGELARPHFARLRRILDRLRSIDLGGAPLRHLSAGMTDDFEDAIREGATIVRIGRAIFGREGVST